MSTKGNLMDLTVPIRTIMLGMTCLGVVISAQAKELKTENAGYDNITEEYAISERTNEHGEQVPLIEYSASATVQCSYQSVISIMKDVANHNKFTNSDISKKVEALSDSEWVVYYYSKVRLLTDYDCVAIMTIHEDAANKSARFAFTSAPALYRKTGANRFTYYTITYEFKDLNNGFLAVTMTAKMTPPIKVPPTMTREAFVGAVADCFRKFIKLAWEVF
jgi:hypothetical protein